MSNLLDCIFGIGVKKLLRYKIIGVAVSSCLLVGMLNAEIVHGQEASGESLFKLQVQSNTAQADEVQMIQITAGTKDKKYIRSTVDRLNVRTGPDLNSSVIRKIDQTNRYEVLDEQEEWVKIRLPDEGEGWIFKEFTEYENTEEPANPEAKPAEEKRTDEVWAASLNEPTVVKIIDITNLRSGPDIDYDIIGKAMPGETFPIVETDGEWYMISLPDDSTAYVASWVVETDFLKRNANLNPPKSTNNVESAPILYIYHTHNRESWKNIARNTKGSSVDDPEVNITLVGKRLGQLLQEKDIPALTGEEDIAERLKQQKLSYSKSYSVSRQAVDKAVETYPSLYYFFDIHRDADVPREKTTVTIDGKTYARVLFVIGTAHSGYEENQAFAEELNKLLKKKYPGLSRGVLTKSAHQGDGEYNQSVSPGSLLMEIGGTNNTLQESLHTAEALADVFAEYYNSVK